MSSLLGHGQTAFRFHVLYVRYNVLSLFSAFSDVLSNEMTRLYA